MKVAIMQPYIFPYIGYFQLIREVDIFILYNDVQYIKRGWINRNRILVNGKPYQFTFGLKKGSQCQKINERIFSVSIEQDIEKLIKTLELAYRKAPYFNETMSMIKEILYPIPNDLSDLSKKSIEIICKYLKIDTLIINSSDIENNGDELKGEERIIHLSSIMGAREYINAIGGQDLYSKQNFMEKELKLNFLKTKEIRYPQFGDIFIPNLSILDVMMFNSKKDLEKILCEYDLI